MGWLAPSQGFDECLGDQDLTITWEILARNI
jgi:hypothetical protein